MLAELAGADPQGWEELVPGPGRELESWEELEAELGGSWDGALDGGWEAEQARKIYLHIYFFDLVKKCLSEPKNVSRNGKMFGETFF